MQKRLLIGLCVAVFLAVAARPFWQTMVLIFEDPVADHGAGVFSFRTEQSDAIHIVAFRVGDKIRLVEDAAGTSYTVSGPSQPGTMSAATLSAREGRHKAEIRYRVGDSTEVKVFEFDVEFAAQTQCDVVVRFGQEGPRASACNGHRPAAYGGTWRH